jgi:hypothetical protein
MGKRYRVYIQKVDDFSVDLSYEDGDLEGLEGKRLLAAVADDAAEQGLGDWDFLEGNTIALSAVEINEDGTEGESFVINEEV